MDAFKTLSSLVMPLPLNNVDTDMIIPAQYLTQIQKEGYGAFLFQRLREHDPNFVLNQPQYTGAKILLGRSNFGCGSSREHAVWALQQAGFRVVVAESFSDIFFNNAAKNGLLLLALSPADMDHLFQITEKKLYHGTVDLAAQTFTIEEKTYHFDYDPFRKTCLLNGYDDMDYLLNARAAIDTYEKKYRSVG